MPNDKEGTIAWGVIISKGKVSKTLSDTLNNYKTSQEAKEETLKNKKDISNNKIKAIVSKKKLISRENLLNN